MKHPFLDEQDNPSTARVLLAVWLVNVGGRLWWGQPDNPELALHATVITALVAWAGGARVAQYVAPQIGAAAQAVAQAAKRIVAARRDAKDGIEVSK